MDANDKDRKSPWVTVESRLVVGVHYLQGSANVSATLSPDNYRLSSSCDPAYAAAGRPPAAVSYRYRMLYGALLPTPDNTPTLRFGHHAFLALPPAAPLNASCAYVLSVARAAFNDTGGPAQRNFSLPAYSERSYLNTNIRVNQVGYLLSGAPKWAHVGAYLGSRSAAPPYLHTPLELPLPLMAAAAAAAAGNATAAAAAANSSSTSNSTAAQQQQQQQQQQWYQFKILNAVTGAAVYNGTLVLVPPAPAEDGGVDGSQPDRYTGQRVWRADFSALAAPGRYQVHVPGLGVSHAFRLAADALRPALGALARGVYGQRCGVALSPRWLGPWGATRPEACHVTDAELMPVSPPPDWFNKTLPLPNPRGATTLPANATAAGSAFLPQAPGGTRLLAAGGHHDAGDYGKYVVNSGAMVGWLLAALDVLGAAGDDLPLPEAGDGVPDIMQEAEWELRFLEGMQDPADGGVHCVVKPNTTAGDFYEGHLPCGTPGADACNQAAGDPRRGPRIVWPKDTTCTAQFAAAMARAARSPWFRLLRPTAAARYLARARAAWDFLQLRAPFGALCFHHYGCGNVMDSSEAVRPPWEHTYDCYDPQNDESLDERLWAAAELYAATGEAPFHAFFLSRHCARYRHYGWDALSASHGLATATYVHLAAAAAAGRNASGAVPVDPVMAGRCVEALATAARLFKQEADENQYGLSLPSRTMWVYGYGWFFPTDRAAHLLVAAALLGPPPAGGAAGLGAAGLGAVNASEAAGWRGAAAAQVSYMLGGGPQGYSLVTGLGARRLTNVVDQESLYDQLEPPWPGLPIGLTGGVAWVAAFGSAPGAMFPPGAAYPSQGRVVDVWNLQAEFVVVNLAQSLAVLTALSDASTGLHATPPPPPNITSLALSAGWGVAPLTVRFSLYVAGPADAVASVEWHFGDGGHSYQAAPTHTYWEAGRQLHGFVAIVDRWGQMATREFDVVTFWAPGTAPVPAAPPANLSLAARVATELPRAAWGGGGGGGASSSNATAATPPLLLANTLPPLVPSSNSSSNGTASTGSSNGSSGGSPPLLMPGDGTSIIPGVLLGGAQASSANLAFQVGRSHANWSGAALRPLRFEDRIAFPLPPPSPANSTAAAAAAGLLGGLAGGAALEAWLYAEAWLSDYRANTLLLGLQYGDRSFGLAGTMWTGLAAVGGYSAFAADDQLAPRLTRGRWHHLRLAATAVTFANGSLGGACSVAVDGRLAAATAVSAAAGACSAPRLFNYCAAGKEGLVLVVQGFAGYVADIRIYASPTNQLGALCGPRPSPPPPPRPPAPNNRYYTATADAGTLAVVDFDAACGKAGDALVSALPLRMYAGGAPSGVAFAPSASSYPAGLAASADGVSLANSSAGPGNTRWMQAPAGCSLRVGSQPAAGGRAGVSWTLPASALAPLRASGCVSLDAKLFVESWRTSWSYWSGDVLALSTNWDAFLSISVGLWGWGVTVWTPGAGGVTTLLNSSALEAAVPPGSWHHVALTANSSACAFAVDGVEVAARAPCSAAQLLPAAGSAQNQSVLSVGGVAGWLDDLRLSSVWRRTQKPGDFSWSPPPPTPSPPPAPPPSPSPPPPSPPVAFYTATADAGTLAVVDFDAACGKAGDALVSALPLRMYAGGAPSGITFAPSASSYPAGLAASADGVSLANSSAGPGNTRWMQAPAGCSLRLGSQPAAGGRAGVSWTLPASALAPLRASGCVSLDAKLFVESWKTSWSYWSGDVLALSTNWDAFLSMSVGLWGWGVTVWTPGAGGVTTLLNSSALEAAIPPGSWHHVALTANSSACAFAVDGVEVAARAPCSAAQLLPAAGSAQNQSVLSVGGVAGWLDDLRLSSVWRRTQKPGDFSWSPPPPTPSPPPAPPPSPSPPPPSPPVAFYTATADAGTLAVVDFDAACGKAGDALVSALPLRMYAGGAPSGITFAPSASSYPAGLAASADGVSLANSSAGPGNTRWMQAPAGCSLRLGSQPAAGGRAGVSWTLPASALAPLRASGCVSLDAKLFVESWKTSWSYWNAEVLSLQSNWDSYLMLGVGLWDYGALRLWTPGGQLATLLNSSALEAAVPPGSWHHVALTANSSACAFAVDGVEVAARAPCSAAQLLPAAGSAQVLTLTVGGIRGWLDDLRLSSVWRRTQKPGDFSWSPPPPRPPSPSPMLVP
ncbi:hypothetical protein HXX76_013011 [Chlamydomonas incerta]|uniref:cellulase n=1 Tax=Chlamydomonas incerta TaxID=51695 RepID=A0A835VUF1_CHLIN|nr:hypothetical protein HXX76_013011 [Chlamydomonas incerta]|eukprot:KAG2426253.1 hypothetical protein HXX76_013011 [Chlamydomonas incerta]